MARSSCNIIKADGDDGCDGDGGGNDNDGGDDGDNGGDGGDDDGGAGERMNGQKLLQEFARTPFQMFNCWWWWCL